MIHVAGGTYNEFCIEPHWELLFGSGLRAAVALSDLSKEGILTTYSGSQDRETLESLAAQCNFDLRVEQIPRTLEFHYHHGLSKPRVSPPRHLIQQAPSQAIEGPNILRFGFLEGDATVHGERVVYDPQNAHTPRFFRENGSTAEKLAIVANRRECIKLAGDRYEGGDTLLLGRAVLEAEGADVVVVKCGSLGATVVTATEGENIPAYRTPRVWPIGSGDVFAAIFTLYWAERKIDAFESARLASLSTAYYCQNSSLPIPNNMIDNFAPEPVITGPGNFPYYAMQVYLAGPFFTMAQRWIIDESRLHLAAQGFQVFSPYHDVGYGSASEVAPADIKALNESEIVFAILDGLDSGTLFEIGYARANNKPVIAFVQNESHQALKMLVGTGCEIINDFVSAIYQTTWAAMAL